MKNYQKVNVPAGEARVELHDSLNLTGAEVSVSNLPAGAGVPFVHSHKQNEEIHAVLSGCGTMVIDGEAPAVHSSFPCFRILRDIKLQRLIRKPKDRT